jgi:hypothetical protein
MRGDFMNLQTRKVLFRFRQWFAKGIVIGLLVLAFFAQGGQVASAQTMHHASPTTMYCVKCR